MASTISGGRSDIRRAIRAGDYARAIRIADECKAEAARLREAAAMRVALAEEWETAAGLADEYRATAGGVAR